MDEHTIKQWAVALTMMAVFTVLWKMALKRFVKWYFRFDEKYLKRHFIRRRMIKAGASKDDPRLDAVIDMVMNRKSS